MLTMVPIKNAQDAKEYFNHDNYYVTGSKEAREASQWWGKGAERLGVSGVVNLDEFETLLEGKMPSGEQLGRRGKNGSVKHRPGYDLTFSAPKSVSMIAEIGGDKRIYDAHSLAVKKALTYAQEHAATVRISRGGQIHFEQVDNLTVSLFRHGTSRTVDDKSQPDPDTHTHAVIHNFALCADGKMRAISSESLFNHKMCLGMIYRANLAHELKKLGYEVEKVRDDGLFEIKGFKREDIEYFSKRHAQIVKGMLEAGVVSRRASNIVSKATRSSKKDYNQPELQAFWQKECEKLELDINAYIDKAKDRGEIKLQNPEQEAVVALKHAVKHHQQREAVFHQRDVIKTALAYRVGKITEEHVIDALAELTKENILVKCHSELWTTQAAIELEQDNISRMQAFKNTTQSILSVKEAKTYVEEVQFSSGEKVITLTDDQKAAVSAALSTTDQIICFNGKPGVGKTLMLNAIKAMAEREDYQCIGLSAQAKAARKIQEESSIDSKTVSKFLSEQEYAISRGSVSNNRKRLIVVDEASMLSSEQVNRLLKVVEHLGSNTHLILQGDQQQLPSIDAGAPFAQFLKHEVEQVHLNEIRRQKVASLKLAVENVLEYNITEAINNIGASNLHRQEDKSVRLENVAYEYLNSSRSVRSRTLVLVPANDDRIIVNDLIREGLKAEGSLSGKEVQTKVLINKGLTRAALTDSFQYEVGDKVRFNQNLPKMGIKSGNYYQIAEIDSQTQTLTLQDELGNKVQWHCTDVERLKGDTPIEVYRVEQRGVMKGDYIRWSRIIDQTNNMVTSETARVIKVDDNEITVKLPNKKHFKLDLNNNLHQHWDYAFSSTVHSAQGQTANYVIAHLDSTRPGLTTQSLFYVAISRAEYGASLHVDNMDYVKHAIENRTGLNVSALDVINEQQWDILPVEEAKKHYSNKKTVDNLIQPKVKLNLAPKYDLQELYTLLQKNSKTVVTEIMGEPNKRLSTANELRYGKKGSLVVSLKPGNEGLWYNHESSDKGNIYTFVKEYLNLSDKETIQYVAEKFNLAPQSGKEIHKQSLKIQAKESEPQIIQPDAADIKAIKLAQKFIKQSMPVKNTVAETYLREHRGINLKEFPKQIRFHPGIKPRGENKKYPALLIPATKGSHVQAVQAIFLDPKTGKKADIACAKNSKLTYGRLRFGATAIINTARSDSKAILAVEGPEDALSLLKVFPNRTVQATLGASSLKNTQSKSKQAIILGLDNDGINAASKKSSLDAISTLASKGHDVYTVMPPNIKEDYNDILKHQGEHALKSLVEKAELAHSAAIDREITEDIDIADSNEITTEDIQQFKESSSKESIELEI